MVELYCIMIPLSTVFKERYNLTNVALAGCVYLANGAGTLAGARITGREWLYHLHRTATNEQLTPTTL